MDSPVTDLAGYYARCRSDPGIKRWAMMCSNTSDVGSRVSYFSHDVDRHS